MDQLIKTIFSLSEDIRYIAIYTDGKLFSSERKELEHASSSESDKYEELIVNPTLLKLLTQRGNIDCGGTKYVLIRYGNFFQFVQPTGKGHLSVGIQLTANPLEIIPMINDAASRYDL